jgi:hypothetical protein
LAGFEVTLYGRFWVTPEAYAWDYDEYCPKLIVRRAICEVSTRQSVRSITLLMDKRHPSRVHAGREVVLQSDFVAELEKRM